MILKRGNDPKRVMSKKNGPYVKADLTSELEVAVKIVTEKLGVSKAHLVTSALEYYLKKNYPESLPKSKLEIYEKVKEDYLYKQAYRNYSDVSLGWQSIPVWEKEIGEQKSKINELEQRLIKEEKTLVNKKNKDIREELKSKISDLKEVIKMEKSGLEIDEKTLDEKKSRRLGV